MKRVRLIIRGAVQGVGFRPFVYRLAGRLALRGFVANSTSGVFIEAEGEEKVLQEFVARLQDERPPHAFIQTLEQSILDPVGHTGFEIRESDGTGGPAAIILPDIATCPECLAELFDPHNRRFRHPFITCTHCGPRFSIITALPYDRPNTSMALFPMCPACRSEYEDPADRRFHAQPIACPDCGPHLALLGIDGRETAAGDDALLRAAEAVRSGAIVALKGIGGFQLIADARNGPAVARLRIRKRREEKPLAIMVPSMASARTLCTIDAHEERLLRAPEAPIVLLRRPPGSPVATEVAPGNPTLGIMLPYSPVHHLLMADLGFPVVATSGNLSEEPMCIDNADALARLGGIADLFLVHDRPIVRHVDDSIARCIEGREMLLRRARGFAPLPVPVRASSPACILATGGHLKNTVGVLSGDNAFISQHIGDLDSAGARTAFLKAAGDLQELCGDAVAVVCDLHPDYASTRHARQTGLPVLAVQHHYAHVLSCMAENELEGPVLGVAWDGTGAGTDGTIWGGEFLVATESTFERAATFRQFRLPGGEQAVREPRRSALGMLFELFGDAAGERMPRAAAFTSEELRMLSIMLRSGLNSPATTSAGRLFDAAASILGLRHRSSFEGQAAMELEFAAATADSAGGIDLPIERMPAAGRTLEEVHEIPRSTVLTIDWAPLFVRLLAAGRAGEDPSGPASLFHSTMAGTIARVACDVGLERVVLTGGCFQNRILCERTIGALRARGFRVYWHQRIPPNDGGIAAGQLCAGATWGWPVPREEPATPGVHEGEG
jgi:hydrogenase maturation protein HypF